MQTIHFAHLSDGTLRALADRQLPLPRRLAAAIHLSHCRRCRDTLRAVDDDARRTTRLLELLDGPVDTDEAWHRIQTRHAALRPPERAAPPARSSRLAWAVA
ncbi:MAG TPA: hypothetical protein VFR95_08825, partial [Gemmatimonadaceae bacterium]|nr:hypothetical protein [Gemmatimonadaceae bacterium]